MQLLMPSHRDSISPIYKVQAEPSLVCARQTPAGDLAISHVIKNKAETITISVNENLFFWILLPGIRNKLGQHSVGFPFNQGPRHLILGATYIQADDFRC